MFPVLSIIIPCYNGERFIDDTLRMMLQQDLADCELIVINDGSTDNTSSILRKYESYPQIRIINQPNQGVSVARNNGLSAAQGRYIYFFDSDDALTDGSVKYFKQLIAEHPNCQMFALGYETRRNGVVEKKYVYPSFDKKELSGRELMQNFLTKKFCIHICSCIYERRYLLDNHFCFKPGIAIGEDVLFLLQTMFSVKRVFYSERLSFVYQIRNDSAMQGYKSYSMKQYNSHTLLREYLLPIANMDNSMSNYIYFFLLFSYLSNLRYYMKSDVKSVEINRQFVKDGGIRYKACWGGNFFLWMLMKLTMFFPLRLSLQMVKR